MCIYANVHVRPEIRWNCLFLNSCSWLVPNSWESCSWNLPDAPGHGLGLEGHRREQGQHPLEFCVTDFWQALKCAWSTTPRKKNRQLKTKPSHFVLCLIKGFLQWATWRGAGLGTSSKNLLFCQDFIYYLNLLLCPNQVALRSSTAPPSLSHPVGIWSQIPICCWGKSLCPLHWYQDLYNLYIFMLSNN